MDIFGVNRGELGYDSNNVDFSSHCFFSINGENNLNTEYVADSFNVKNIFGSISLRKKEYCILNKQYLKEKYNELVAKIKKHMDEMPYIDSKGRIYKYGELFPMENAPFSYNETLAQEYLPITKDRAIEMGYSWYDMEDKNYIPTKSWGDLPQTIQEVDDSILSEIILCEAWDKDKNKSQEHKCTKAFKITKNELIMYKKWNIPLPRKCPNTRNFELFKSRNPVEFYSRNCMCEQGNHHNHSEGKCEEKFETTYAPDRPETIYCESCYQQEVA
jgi:hypothetical protein